MIKVRPLTPALADKAARELNESTTCVRGDLDALKAWVSRQPHLRARTIDQFLIAFLRASKFSIEKAKQKIDNFYTLRELMPEVFRNRNVDDPKTLDIVKLGSAILLPPLTEDGPRVAMLRLGRYDFHKYTAAEIIKVAAMMADILLYEDDNAIVAGYILIMDLADLTPYHLFHFDAVFIKKLSIIANKAMPSRMKGFHFINVLPSFEKLFNMVKSVINEKLKSRFYVHGNHMDSLFDYVPRKCLPEEYGGEAGRIEDNVAYWVEKLQQNREFYKEEEYYGTIESKRIGKPMNTEAMFGIDGSFRQLNVD